MPTADEFAAIVHLQAVFGDDVARELAESVGLPELDCRWVTPSGRDVTALCDASDNGGFSSSRWTMQGWVLDDLSMRALENEFQHEFR